MDSYKVYICCSFKFYQGFDDFKNYFREIDTIKDKTIKGLKIFAFDIVLDNNVNANNYVDKLVFDKINSLIIRNDHSKFLNENHFNSHQYFKIDPEIIFLRPKILNTFVKYYNHGYKLFKNEKLTKAYEAIKSALTLNPDDVKTKYVFMKIETFLNDIKIEENKHLQFNFLNINN